MKKNRTIPGGAALSVLINGLLLALLLAGSLLNLNTGYGLGLEESHLLLAAGAVILLCLLISALPRFRAGAWLLVLAGWGVLLWQWWEELLPGWGRLLNQVTDLLERGLGLTFDVPLPVTGDPAQATVAMVMLMFPWGLLLSWSVLWAESSGLTLLLAWLPLIPAFGANGALHWPGMLALASASLAQLIAARPSREDARGGAGLKLLALVLSGLVLCLLVWLDAPERYQYPQWANDARIRLTEAAKDIPNPLLSEGGLGDVTYTPQLSETVDLTEAGPLQYSGTSVLRVESDQTGVLYLRGFSMAVYTGSSWEPLEQDAYQAALPWPGPGELGEDASYSQLLAAYPTALSPAIAQGGAGGGTVEIIDLGLTSDWVYTPYQLAGLSGLEPGGDSFLDRTDGRWQHTFSWSAPDLTGLVPLSGEVSQAEQLYTTFVEEYYLQLPDGLLERLDPYVELARAQQNELTGEDVPYQYREAVTAAQGVARMLAEYGTYDPETPVIPDGADFVLYFLENGGRGYCMHFASAGTLLLRAMGIPARYVAGYAVNTQAGVTADVPDSAAHAWVEIYLAGYGWYPVEMTPGYDGLSSEPEAPDGEELPEEQEEPESPEEPQEPETMPEARPEEPETEIQPILPAPEEGEGSRGDSAFPAALWITPLAVLLLGAGFWGARRLLLSRRERAIAQRDTNRSVLELYGCFQRLERWGGETPEELTALAQKARFSQHRITEAERDEARRQLHRFIRKTGQQLPGWRRLFFWLFWDR